jgi:hypothetical protein
MSLTFPEKRAALLFGTQTVAFPARDAQMRVVRCQVSVEALHSHFGLTIVGAAAAVEAFEANRPAIEGAASRKHRAEAGEHISLTSPDIVGVPDGSSPEGCLGSAPAQGSMVP